MYKLYIKVLTVAQSTDVNRTEFCNEPRDETKLKHTPDGRT